MDCNKPKESVRQLFVEYLKKRGHRKTPERFAILDEIYSGDGHFNVESLFVHMKNKNYRVSRATIYNTIDVLLDCNLIIKHQFGKNMAQFERAYDCFQHDHLICTNCGKVTEFCDPRIKDIQETAGNTANFEITNHALYYYGICADCKKKNKNKN